MPADPVLAGRKGGRSRSQAKLDACRRNGFQRVKKAENMPTDKEKSVPVAPSETLPILAFNSRKENE